MLPLFSTPCRAAAAAGAEAAGKIRIAFAGDSIVDNYWSGIERIVDANPCLKNTVELGRFARNGTGLTRGDRVYWPREIRRIDDGFKPTLSVLSIGLNDRQFIVDGNGARTAWGAPDWTDKYRHEVLEFLKAAVATKAVVLMVGMPAMREAIDNADIDGKNAMFADAVAALGDPNLHYIEPWRLHASGTETFASYGPRQERPAGADPHPGRPALHRRRRGSGRQLSVPQDRRSARRGGEKSRSMPDQPDKTVEGRPVVVSS